MDATQGISAQLWLTLLKEGGRSTAREVADLLSRDSLYTQQSLNSMCRHGSVRKYERTDTSKRVTYGVTPDCQVPVGVTVGDILACNLPRVEGGA